MTYYVSLKILNGQLKDQIFTFNSRTSCLVGSAKDCHISFANCSDHQDISKYHCLIEIDPPNIKIKEHCLESGDIISLGSVEIEVNISQKKCTKKHQIKQPEQNLGQKYRSNGNIIEMVKNLLKRALGGKEKDLIAIEGYDLKRILSKAAFGEIYLAQNNRTQEYVALKVMLPEVATTKRQKDKFFRELDNMRALNHPNIVQLRDYGFSDNIFFFTLEYCNSGTLEDLMKQRQKPLELPKAVSLIIPILNALDYAHNIVVPYVRLANGTIGKGSGLVHRDINPSNILLTRILVENKGQKIIPKLADFGLSKAFDQAGLSGVSHSGHNLEGTFEFMCREQIIQFKYAKPEIDVWATVACFYYLLTGHAPREFGQHDDPLMRILQTNPIPIRNYNPNIPQPLADLIDLALIDHPQLHFKNAIAFKKALISVLKLRIEN